MNAAASAGVVVAVDDLVVAQALVPKAADHLGRNVPDLPTQRKSHVWSTGEGELYQLGIIGGDLHVKVGIELLRPVEFRGDLRG